MSAPEWIGLRLFLDDHGYGVSPIPGRKRVALYRSTGNGFRAVAYFADESDARDFAHWLGRLAATHTEGQKP